MFGEVQTKILLNLLRSEGLRYSEAYPGEEIDDDLYNYHLQQLVKNGLVERVGGQYGLTRTGREKVQMMDAGRGEYQDQFRVSVLMYVARSNNQEILMCKRTRWPERGDVASPSGKVRRGETIVEAARRKLLEETGLEAEFKLRGVLRSARKFEGKWVEDTIYHVCWAGEPRGELKQKTEWGEFEWMDWDKAVGLQKKNIGGSEAQEEILQRMRDGKKEVFYLEEQLELTSY